jgi:hypothetical protein
MNLIIANSLVGVALIYLGYSSGGMGFIAVWLGVGFVLTALGYSGMDARIYGKKVSGQFPAWAIMLYLPFFIYTECIWRLVQPLIREQAYNWVTDNIIIGRRLCTRSFPEGVINYVDLTAEFYEPKAVIENLVYVSLPILDGNVPDIRKLNQTFEQLSDDITYIHCGQGHGRSGLFTILLLARRGLISTPEDGLALLKSKRPKLTLTKKQDEFVRKVMK